MAKTLSPLESFLAPLAKLTARYPDAEGEVIWAEGAEWAAQDDNSEWLDAEEIPFYAEGLLLEGFHMQWQALAEAENPGHAAHFRLFFWQGQVGTPPGPESGLLLLASGTWTN